MLLVTYLFLVLAEEIGKGSGLSDYSATPRQGGRRNPYYNQWELSGKYQGDIIPRSDISPRNIAIGYHWTKGIVAYTLAPGQFNTSELASIMTAFKTIEDVFTQRGFTDGSCQVKFEPRTEQDVNYALIMKGDPNECYSGVGMCGGMQNISLGDNCVWHVGTILHEFLHLLGLGHQHQATIRDNYVKIIKENIQENLTYAFDKYIDTYYTDMGVPYDFKSIMHYSQYAFAKEVNGTPVGPTIVPVDPNMKLELNEDVLSEGDKVKLELMYCKDHTSVSNGIAFKEYNVSGGITVTKVKL